MKANEAVFHCIVYFVLGFIVGGMVTFGVLT